MPIQELGGMTMYALCAVCALLILSMAAYEWRRLSAADYGRIALAAGIVLVGRLLGGLSLGFGWPAARACPEWTLQTLALALFISAYLYTAFSPRGWVYAYLVVALTAVGGGLALCLMHPDLNFFPSPSFASAIVLLVLAGFGLVLWLRRRPRFSWWLGSALLVSIVGAVLGLMGLDEAAWACHVIALVLFVIETYLMVLNDWSAYGRELQKASEQALHHSQEMAFMLELSQAIASSLDLPDVLVKASEAVARSVDADWAHILLPVDGEPDALAVKARYGWWGSRQRQEGQVRREVAIRLGDFSLLRHAVTLKRQVKANTPKDYAQFERLHDLLGRPQSGPTLVQPICVQDQVLGVVLLGYIGKQRSFSQADGRLCQALVAQAATAIENARLYQRLDARAKDLAEQLAAQEAQSGQYRAILDSVSDGVLVIGHTGEVVAVNPAAERILAMPPDNSVVQLVKGLASGTEGAPAKEDEGLVVFEWKEKTLKGSLATLRLPDGDQVGHVIVFRDFTRGHLVDRALEEYVAAVAQESRGPVSSIKSSVELLDAGAAGTLSFQQLDFMEGIGQEADKLAGLVNNLIAVSETELGSMPIEAKPVDMKVVIEDAVQAAQSQAAASQLDLLLNLPDTLRPALGEAQALRQIMDNLLDNAMRSTPVGGQISIWAVEAHLKGDAEDSRNHLVISVRDSGPGLSHEGLEHVFDRFYFGETSSPAEAGGTGMEVAIVRSLVEAHLGRLTVESEPGEGTVFAFTLPAQSG